MRSLRVISSRKSESALVGIHGRAELSASDERVSESNSAPPVIIREHLLGSPEVTHCSSSDTRDRLLESLSDVGPDAQEVAAWKCNPFALSRAIRRKYRHKTIWNMLSRIDEIPEQVEGMLTQTASDLSMQVDGSVVQMQDRLREASGEEVAETLEMLPRYFATSVEANLMDAAALLRETVSSVTAELGAKDFEEEDIVQEIQIIPQKVRKVADEVISRAVNASVEELHQQLDEALGVLSTSCAVREKELLQHLDQLPLVAEKRIGSATGVVDLAEDKIVDLVADLRSEFVPNHWLMEALLRAKASKGERSQVSTREIVHEHVRSQKSQDAENEERGENGEKEDKIEGEFLEQRGHDQEDKLHHLQENEAHSAQNPGSSLDAS